jgi:hypothetical protein
MARTRNWRRASARADRVLIGVMAIVIAGSGGILGASAMGAPPAVRILRTVVEYVQPPASEPQTALDAARGRLLAEHRCLAEAMYYEARGEGEAGEKAVAEVVFDRVESGVHGRSICAVVYEGAPRPGCQFSFACDGSRARAKSVKAWRDAEVLAADILAGVQSLAGATGNAMNYHATYVRPVWASKLVRTAQIGNHIFYRPQLRGTQD